MKNVVHYPLAGVEFSSAPTQPDIVITDRRGLACCQLMAAKGKHSELASLLGISDQPGRSAVTAEYTALPLSPGQWLVIGQGGRDGAFTKSIGERIGRLGHASEQSHARTIIRMEGIWAYDALAKGCRLDLDPRNAPAGYVAQTIIAQVGVTLHKLDDKPVIDLVVFAGFAECFWDWLIDACAEYNVDTCVTT